MNGFSMPFTANITQQLKIILQAKKCLLLSKYKPWEKTINESLLGITIRSYDGPDICEPLGLYTLSIHGKANGIQSVVSTGTMV